MKDTMILSVNRKFEDVYGTLKIFDETMAHGSPQMNNNIDYSLE